MSNRAAIMEQAGVGSQFLWGTATSAHQVEGNNRANDWWDWEQQGKLKEPSGVACDHYRLFREDIGLISSLGQNAHRFSLEWSRFEPEENHWNDEAFRHYEEVFQELSRRRIEPVVTLHHFTNPRWFSEKGGWLEPSCVDAFNRYVERVVRAYGKYVRFWITINEPLIYVYYSFYAGLWPPGRRCYKDSLKVIRFLVKAHKHAYRIIHDYYETVLKKPVWVSFANYMVYFSPCRSHSLFDRWTAAWTSRFVNEIFIEAAIGSFLFYPGIFCEYLFQPRALDYLAVNYYSQDFIRFRGLFAKPSMGEICSKDHHPEKIGERNALGWNIYPEGLRDLIQRLRRFRLPIMVSENGICTPDDEQRARFIRDHVDVLGCLRKDGVPIFGYFYWSLLDNFEWAHGFGPRFGIVEVDYRSQERRPRPSSQVLAESCRKLICTE
ncbi:MAG: family 1 glycosylhydrolase [Candidatus Omnitrophica bacterium]|nr:family 1 glycosylhydrolase [Candidatus Omnitrophota bacterium]